MSFTAAPASGANHSIVASRCEVGERLLVGADPQVDSGRTIDPIQPVGAVIAEFRRHQNQSCRHRLDGRHLSGQIGQVVPAIGS